uniref:FBD domain-containing protein n=1 Tax=Triticum urartu TaxID=4572 RepID=A0A8R7QFL4_TRIUA
MGPNLDAIVGFLRCFPCLEKLYIHMNTKNLRQYDPLVDPVECLDLHLREIVLYNYQGKKPDVDFAKFFVLNARVLKVMKFGVLGASCNEKWMASQHRRLQLDNRASCDAQFDFKRNFVIPSFSYGKHLHYMWMPDPFDSSLCKCC